MYFGVSAFEMLIFIPNTERRGIIIDPIFFRKFFIAPSLLF
jgi:hypothetical protein